MWGKINISKNKAVMINMINVNQTKYFINMVFILPSRNDTFFPNLKLRRLFIVYMHSEKYKIFPGFEHPFDNIFQQIRFQYTLFQLFYTFASMILFSD